MLGWPGGKPNGVGSERRSREVRFLEVRSGSRKPEVEAIRIGSPVNRRETLECTESEIETVDNFVAAGASGFNRGTTGFNRMPVSP